MTSKIHSTTTKQHLFEDNLCTMLPKEIRLARQIRAENV